MATYHIAFDGKLTGDIELAIVKKNLAALFKMNATQVEALFTGKPVVVKRDVDEATAKKYAAVFKKAGAVCSVVNAEAQQRAATPPKSPAPAPAGAAQQPPTASPQDRGGRMAGKDIVHINVPQNLGDLSMAGAGEQIPTLDVDVDVQIPDTSSLSMSNDDGYLAPEHEDKPPQVDISGLSLEKSD